MKKPLLACGIVSVLLVALLLADSSAPPTFVAVAPEKLDGLNLQLPTPGRMSLRVLSPTLLEIARVNTKAPDPARVDSWDFVDAGGNLQLPAASAFTVSVGGQPAAVQAVGFKRRPLYAPLAVRDLRIDNRLYLQLSSPVADGQTVVVVNPDATLWPANLQLSAASNPLRYSPAIHVNEEGYEPGLPAQAMVGYFLGSLGELTVPAQTFQLVRADTGAAVFQGALTARPDAGFVMSPVPYQAVMAADFSAFTTPGTYQLVVPGLGASLPFRIQAGTVMDFERLYALGFYQQRCGTAVALPFSRFVHDACHTAPASVPSPQSSFSVAWSTIAADNADYANNPRHTAPQLKDEASQLYPFVNTGAIDVCGGHHDAGDYSKYTIDSALLIHHLVFAADAFPGAGALDNLGIPESGDGRSDLLQEAKVEADFLAKMQDADGGFYFLVYPRNRSYESDVMPDHGDPQVVWPKNTSATASAVAALAQMSSSPLFRQQFPDEAAAYWQKAQLGWTFLMNAIAAHGKDGSYQKLTHYGDQFMHDDELAWAACEMFVATGDPSYQQQLIAWYDPSDPATRQWTWWRLPAAYGCAARDFAFAARTGRLSASQLDATYLSKCQTEIIAAGDDMLTRCNQNAYGTPFDVQSKRSRVAGWYFGTDRAFDMITAYQLNGKADYLAAYLTSLNYEAGCNPLNVSYLTGIGSRRQREIVSQEAQNDWATLPPSGLPLGQIQAGFYYMNNYTTELGALCSPLDGSSAAPYPFYDRWGDAYNVNTEATVVNQARSLAGLAFLAASTSTATQSWTTASAQINVPSGYSPVNQPLTVTMSVPGMDLSSAEVVWEAMGQQPYRGGASYTFTPATIGRFWLEAEAHWPDGRRVSASAAILTNAGQSQSNFVLDTNTVALYHFDGNFQDASPNAFHLTASGNVLLASDNLGWMASPAGQVARFTNAGDTLTVSIPDAFLLPGTTATPFTLEAQIYPRVYRGYSVNQFPVVSLLQNYDTSLQLLDGKWNIPHVPTVISGATTFVTPTQWSNAVSMNAWHAMKLTYDATGTASCYIDGNLVSSGAAKLNYQRNTPWTLTLGNFSGDIDEVRISNVVR